MSAEESDAMVSDPSVFNKTEVEADQMQFLDEEDPAIESPSDELSKRLLNGADLSEVSPDLFPSVFTSLMRYRESRMNALDVDGAEKADRILVALQESGTNSLLQTARDDRDATFSRRISAATRKAEKVENRYSQWHQHLATMNSERIARLKETHERERAEFDNLWITPAKTRLFSQATLALRSMRVQNIWLMKARRYADQRLIQQGVNEREQWETEEQARAMLMEYEVHLKALTDRQTQEMDGLLQANESRLFLRKKFQDRDVFAARQRIQNIENEWKIQRDSGKFLSGGRPGSRRARTGQSLTGPRSLTLNMAQIATVDLPPLLPNIPRRPNCGGRLSH
jgi:hypothetical protein